MILQHSLQGQVQTCCHWYRERLMPNYSNNKYYMSFGDIISLVLLGGIVLYCYFCIINWYSKYLICFCIITHKFSLIKFFNINLFHVSCKFFSNHLWSRSNQLFCSCWLSLKVIYFCLIFSPCIIWLPSAYHNHLCIQTLSHRNFLKGALI